jgi:hypothetical protein
MIRAVLQNGVIWPIDPIAPGWVEGQQVVVEDAGSASIDDLEGWYRELNQLGPALYEPGEWEEVQALMAQADEQASRPSMKRCDARPMG